MIDPTPSPRYPDVRINLDTHRVVTVCPCGLTISFSDSGVSSEVCPCGRLWEADDQRIAMYEPTGWHKVRGREN